VSSVADLHADARQQRGIPTDKPYSASCERNREPILRVLRSCFADSRKVLEIVTELDAELGRCMTKEARDVQLPAAPREDFWIQVNLAAML
jgi:hypothetical protein